MTKPHRATPEQWADTEQWASEGDGITASCILELRDRVAALEAAQRPSAAPAVEHVLDMQERIQEGTLTLAEALQEIGAPTPAPAESLAERVAEVMRRVPNCDDKTWGTEARAAIREIAAALIEWHDSDQLIRTAWEAAKWLEREAGQ